MTVETVGLSEDKLALEFVGVAELFEDMEMMITKPKNPAIIQVNVEVFFLAGAPHLGHLSALLLISVPHSPHLISAKIFPLISSVD